MKIQHSPLTAFLMCLLSATAAGDRALAGDLKSDVGARSSQVEQLAGEAVAAVAAWESSNARTEAADAKSKYLSQEALYLADAEARTKDPEKLLKAELSNVSLAQSLIRNIIESSPEARHLSELTQKAATIDATFAGTGKQLNELGKIMRQSADNDANTASLEATQQALRSRIATLTTMVAAEKDAQVKAHNQAILDQASALLSGLDNQIADLKATAANDQGRVTDLIGESDMKSAAAVVIVLESDWNKASLKLQHIVNTNAQIVDAYEVPSGLPASVDEAVTAGYASAPPGVGDRVRKAFQAISTHDWKLAKAWLEDALNHDPGNAGLKRLIDLADYTGTFREQKTVINSGTANKPITNEEIPADADERTYALTSNKVHSHEAWRRFIELRYPEKKPMQLPSDSDLTLLFPDSPAEEAEKMNDYVLDAFVKMTETDPQLIRLSQPAAPTGEPSGSDRPKPVVN